MSDPTRVALFATCLVNLMRPRVGFAALKLLEKAGFQVDVPIQQTCCGQPNFNSGDREGARSAAKQTLEVLRNYDYVVVPSGSCAGMIRKHYPTLFDEGTPERKAFETLSSRTHELVSFLTDVANVDQVTAKFDGVVTYHDSCAGLREMGVKGQPRSLLSSMVGCSLKEMEDPEVCCGFGGTFCVKYPDLSNEMVRKKTDSIVATDADCVAMGDVGCLLNIEGKLHRDGKAVPAYHVAELLAGMIKDEAS